MIERDLNTLAKEIHADNVAAGWWADWPNKSKRFYTARMLVATELAEAAEGARKDLMDDHLPQYPMFQVELADAAIRLLDLAGAHDVGVEYDSTTHKIYMIRKVNEAKNKLELLDLCLSFLYASSNKYFLGTTIRCIVVIAEHENFDLFEIIAAKRAYNQTREDHKRENRAKAHGKKW